MRLVAAFFILLYGFVDLLAQGPGPVYFVTDPVNPNQFYWRSRQVFGGVTTHQNYNLLASLLGDKRTAPSGTTLVGSQSYYYTSSRKISIPPFAYNTSNGTKKGLPIGGKLKKFLSDPLGGGKFNLSLPFKDRAVALSDRSALVRKMDGGGTDRIWHVAIDFDYSGNPSKEFEVFAPADGVVIGYRPGGSSMTIKHRGSNGREFLTIYQHLDPSSVPSNLEKVRRGQFIGRIEAASSGYAHLHFGVAVKGPSGVVNGFRVPALWYLIDPFGVYDYRRNSTNRLYNYLPNNRIDATVKGIRHVYVFKSNPPIKSLIQ